MGPSPLRGTCSPSRWDARMLSPKENVSGFSARWAVVFGGVSLFLTENKGILPLGGGFVPAWVQCSVAEVCGQ